MQKPLTLCKMQGNQIFIYYEKKTKLIVKYINDRLTIFKHFVLDCLYSLSYDRTAEGYL